MECLFQGQLTTEKFSNNFLGIFGFIRGVRVAVDPKNWTVC